MEVFEVFEGMIEGAEEDVEEFTVDFCEVSGLRRGAIRSVFIWNPNRT